MMTLRSILLPAAICLNVGIRAFAQPSLPDRVAADFPNASDAAFRHYAVPAMSENQRLPLAYPDDGVAGGTVTIIAARDEYEPGSFLVWGTRDLGKVAFSLSPFRMDDGTIFPAADLDLKVVKVWYQNRNAWFSYFGDTGFKLVPELLLNDEDLIRVDTEKTANYARLKSKDGQGREHWINPPRQFDARSLREPWRTTERFHCMRLDFDDADTLQPVAVEKHQFKQFMLTAHIGRATKAGLYRGSVRVGTFGEIPVAIRVLDFTLPAPKCYANPEKDFLVSSYSYISQENIAELNGFDWALARRQLVNVFKNQVAHNQTMHMVRGNADAMAFDCLEAMREAGMRMDVFQGAAGPVGPAGEESRARAQRVADIFDWRYGHHNVFISYGDEPSAAWLEKARPIYEDYQRAGLRFFIAGHDAVFYKAGYLYDWHNTATDPSDGRVTHQWNALQNGNRIAWYANQHVGSENPAFNRRQNGLMAYLSGYTALCNYAHHFGPYNDDSTTYRPMVYAYGCGGGVIDTLQWEGFREGIDDIRYATLMTDLARKAQASSDVSVRYLGGKAMQMLASLDRKSFDQDACRGEMIRFIEALRPHVSASAAKSEWKMCSESERRAAKDRLDEGLARDLATVRQEFAAATRQDQTNAVHRKIGATYANYFRFAEAGDYLSSVGLDAEGARYYDYLPGTRKQQAWRKALRATTGRERGRLEAYWNLLADDPNLADEFDAVVMAGIRKDDTNAVRFALNGAFYELGSRRTCLWSERFTSFVRVYEKAVAVAARVGIPVPVAVSKNAFEAYFLLGDPKNAVRAAQLGFNDPNAKPAERYHLSLAALLGELTTADEAVFRAKVADFVAWEGKDVPAKERVAALDAVGSILHGCGYERLVRELTTVRKSICPDLPKRRYVVTFSDVPVEGIGDYDRLAAPEADCDRRYGGSLEFLETDVTTGNRATGNSAEALPDPKMKIVADERGLHFFFSVADPKARDVELGLTGGGSYECYLAPGANEPYVCLCFDPQSDEMYFFNTTYPTFSRRRLEAEEGGRDYRKETRFFDNRVVTYLFLSWRTWSAKIPQNGSVWDFEALHWSRTGNSCWNGLESIHGRSTWGELEFRLTRPQRSRILKPILSRARTEFLRERTCGKRDGVFAHWKDTSVGDPEFYAAELQPLLDELTAAGERVRAEMTDDEIERLEREVLPQWLDVSFEVQRRRTRWLEARQIDGNSAKEAK